MGKKVFPFATIFGEQTFYPLKCKSICLELEIDNSKSTLGFGKADYFAGNKIPLARPEELPNCLVYSLNRPLRNREDVTNAISGTRPKC